MVKKSAARRLKEEFSSMPASYYKTLTFGKLSVGDRYIALPLPGDNHGHGGFAGAHYLFEKTEPTGIINKDDYNLPSNSRKLKDGTLSSMPDTMPVIKVE